MKKTTLSSWVMLLTWMVFLKEFSVAQDSALEEAWRDWKKTYEKVYTDEEEATRRATWEKNLQMVEQHNREADEGKQTYWVNMNQFSDLGFLNLSDKQDDSDLLASGLDVLPALRITSQKGKHLSVVFQQEWDKLFLLINKFEGEIKMAGYNNVQTREEEWAHISLKQTDEELKHMVGGLLPVTVDPDNTSQGFPQAPDIQQAPMPKKCHQRRYGTSRKDQLALAYRRKRGKHRSENLGKLCLISINGTKKLLGRRCGCISRYRRRCQKCCKLAL